jgi:hypothetical protein
MMNAEYPTNCICLYVLTRVIVKVHFESKYVL